MLVDLLFEFCTLEAEQRFQPTLDDSHQEQDQPNSVHSTPLWRKPDNGGDSEEGLSLGKQETLRDSQLSNPPHHRHMHSSSTTLV